MRKGISLTASQGALFEDPRFLGWRGCAPPVVLQPMGDLLLTSALYDDPTDGATVLHFAVPLKAPGVMVLDTWRTMAMRASGSNDILLEGVFVPDGAVSSRRPKGVWFPFFNVVGAVAVRECIEICADYEFVPEQATFNQIAIRKTIAGQALMLAVEKALETVGGAGIFRSMSLERLVRDIHAVQFHPMQPKRQHRFTGRLTLGLDPVG
jgi:alkylation response protein AidB-like acyl-CoA dehydrogenase